MAKDVVPEFVRAIIDAPWQRTARRKMNARGSPTLVHAFHVNVVEAYSDAQRFAEPVNADWAVLV